MSNAYATTGKFRIFTCLIFLMSWHSALASNYQSETRTYRLQRYGGRSGDEITYAAPSYKTYRKPIQPVQSVSRIKRRLGRYGGRAAEEGYYNIKNGSSGSVVDDSSIFNVRVPYSGHYKVGNPYVIMGQTYYPHENPNYSEIGVSSWYGEDFYGKKTANGEIYNMYDLTAAHRTLPLPSIVRVTNLENGRSIRLRVNDRGPFAKNRIIDVSKYAASQLDFHQQGTTRVKVEFLREDTEQLLRMLNLK